MTIRCAAFDFDGTLVDSNAVKLGGYFVAVEQFAEGESAVRAALARCPRGDRYQVTRVVAEELLSRRGSEAAVPPVGGVDALANALAHAYTAHCELAVTTCAEVPGARGALEVLTGLGLPLYLNTATPREAIVPILERRDLARFFASVHGAPPGKSENLAAIARAAGARPTEVLFVGDGEDDRAAAEEFGCQFIGVALRGESRFSRDVPHLLPDLTRLPDCVSRLGIDTGENG